MKDFNQSKIANCEQAEELLVRQIFEDLNGNETQELNDHLKICAHCQSYRRQLVSLQQLKNIKHDRSLIPNPAIRTRIMQQMKSRRIEKASFIQIIWQKVLGMMQYRIPVYQGVIGMAVSLFILFAVNNISITPKHAPKVAPEFHVRNEVGVSQLNVIQSLEIIEQQKVGRSAIEDTSLTRFIVTAM